MGSGVVVEVELEELWVGSGVGSVFDVELSATELLEAVELELDELELLELVEDELDVDELELDEEELLDESSSGLSSPQPVRSADAAKIPAISVTFFIKTSLKQIYSYYSTFWRICQGFTNL